MRLRYSCCVCEAAGRLSLVGGGMVKRFGLPSLSYHQGCESLIKLSLSSFLFFLLSFAPLPIHLFFRLYSPSFPFFTLGFTFIYPKLPTHFLSFLSLYIPSLIQVLLSQSRLLITANIRRADCLSEQQRKFNKAVPIPHPFPITRLERRWPTLRGGSVIKIDGAETAIGHTSRSRRPPVFLEASDNKQ